jgi:hypothetical protein
MALTRQELASRFQDVLAEYQSEIPQKTLYADLQPC